MPMSQQLAISIGNLIAANTPILAFAGADRFLALHTADPTKTCLVGEISGSNYSRAIIPISIIQLAKGKGMVNDEVIVFPAASGTIAQQILYGSIWDQLNGGTPITYAALSAPVNWTSGASLSLAVNAFVQLLRDTF